MSIELKIKSKHLSLESQVIRFEEEKLKRQLRSKKVPAEQVMPLETKLHSLTNHRKLDVRNENRATFLARAYLEGKPYSSVEPRRRPDREFIFKQSIVPRVVAMVTKYGNREQRKIDKSVIEEWSKM